MLRPAMILQKCLGKFATLVARKNEVAAIKDIPGSAKKSLMPNKSVTNETIMCSD